MQANPLWIDVPVTLETDRLLLRCPRPGDGQAVNEGLRDSWKELQQWMTWASGTPPPIDETEGFNRHQIADWKAHVAFHFNLFLREDEVFVGKCSLFDIDWNIPKGEIGYWLRTPYTGRGLMTEAVRAVEGLALETLGFVRVEIRCDPYNRRSAAVAERLGYVREARLRNDSRNPRGALRDTLVYSKITL
jgi:RimJ/RimL family protein N-acetyltransferase